jgi:hypothetical protein
MAKMLSTIALSWLCPSALSTKSRRFSNRPGEGQSLRTAFGQLPKASLGRASLMEASPEKDAHIFVVDETRLAISRS